MRSEEAASGRVGGYRASDIIDPGGISVKQMVTRVGGGSAGGQRAGNIESVAIGASAVGRCPSGMVEV